jgi:hypothetical protein
VLGDCLDGGAFGWLGSRTGRCASAREMLAARVPYRAPAQELERIDDAEALRLCRLEQPRQPADVVNVALASSRRAL